MDKYTKGILTVIAVGIIGLNVQMMNGGIISLLKKVSLKILRHLIVKNNKNSNNRQYNYSLLL